MRNRPRIVATNTRMDGRVFVHSWSLRGWSLEAKVHALRELQVKNVEDLRRRRTLMPSILDQAF